MLLAPNSGTGYAISAVILGGDAGVIIESALGGTPLLLERFWVANRRQTGFVFEDSFGPDLTALAGCRPRRLVRLLAESVGVNCVGGVTSIVVNHVRAADPTFDPTFGYGLTHDSLLAAAGTFVGHFVAMVLAMRLGHWSGRLAVVRRVAPPHTAHEDGRTRIS